MDARSHRSQTVPPSRRLRAARYGWLIIGVFLLAALVVPPGQARGRTSSDAAVNVSETMNVGENIYRNGRAGAGAPLLATRDDGLSVQGRDAACVNCHQRSGLGATEGRIVIPPITGRYLFFNPINPSEQDLALPFVEGMRTNREPYTEETLARAIREGIGPDGKPLNYMMPHFALNDVDMAALIGYLKGLDQWQTRGVTHAVLHFATIITPDADPVKRQGMLDVLERFFADKNLAPVGPTPSMRATRKFRIMVNPHWQLHVWQLTGPADTWERQLKQDLAREPVFAVISGLGGKNWEPVHEFCEHEALPCLFPNVEVPPAGADHDFYSVYFSKGVLLEAELIAQRILDPDRGKVAKVVQQVYRAGDSGESGSRALAAMLKHRGIIVRNRVLPANLPAKGVSKALRQLSKADVLVLWLRSPDIAALGSPPPAPTAVFMSGLMGGLENSPLPPGWRERTRLSYPFDLPEQRRIGTDFAFGWFRIRHIPVVADQVQADTYLACGVLAGAVRRLVDAFVPEYLIERIQNMIDNRIITGYYPHLTLAQGQRFASKGGYIVRFPEPEGTRVVADRGWMVP